jgi:hypothetical protein
VLINLFLSVLCSWHKNKKPPLSGSLFLPWNSWVWKGLATKKQKNRLLQNFISNILPQYNKTLVEQNHQHVFAQDEGQWRRSFRKLIKVYWASLIWTDWVFIIFSENDVKCCHLSSFSILVSLEFLFHKV